MALGQDDLRFGATALSEPGKRGPVLAATLLPVNRIGWQIVAGMRVEHPHEDQLAAHGPSQRPGMSQHTASMERAIDAGQNDGLRVVGALRLTLLRERLRCFALRVLSCRLLGHDLRSVESHGDPVMRDYALRATESDPSISNATCWHARSLQKNRRDQRPCGRQLRHDRLNLCECSTTERSRGIRNTPTSRGRRSSPPCRYTLVIRKHAIR